MTYQEKFDYLKATYGAQADFSAVTADVKAQIVMTDEDCHGIFYVTCIGGVPAMEPYDYRDRTVNIIIDSVLLESMLTGETDPVQAYLDGRFTLEGDAEHALMLIGALKKAPAPAKKPAAKKKAAPKKAAEKPAEKKPAAKKAAAKKAAPAEKAAEAPAEKPAEKKPAAKKAAAKKAAPAEKAAEVPAEKPAEKKPAAKKTAAKKAEAAVPTEKPAAKRGGKRKAPAGDEQA